jgi:hypothetical protein
MAWTEDDLRQWREQLNRDATMLSLDLARARDAIDAAQLRGLVTHLRHYGDELKRYCDAIDAARTPRQPETS